jgi:hypothetical protein
MREYRPHVAGDGRAVPTRVWLWFRLTRKRAALGPSLVRVRGVAIAADRIIAKPSSLKLITDASVQYLPRLIALLMDRLSSGLGYSQVVRFCSEVDLIALATWLSNRRRMRAPHRGQRWASGGNSNVRGWRWIQPCRNTFERNSDYKSV